MKEEKGMERRAGWLARAGWGLGPQLNGGGGLVCLVVLQVLAAAAYIPV